MKDNIISRKIHNSILTDFEKDIMIMFINGCCFHYCDIERKFFRSYRVVGYRLNEIGCFHQIREYHRLDNLTETLFRLTQLIKLGYILKFKTKSKLKCIPHTIYYLSMDAFLTFHFSSIYTSYGLYSVRVNKEKKNMINYIRSYK